MDYDAVFNSVPEAGREYAAAWVKHADRPPFPSLRPVEDTHAPFVDAVVRRRPVPTGGERRGGVRTERGRVELLLENDLRLVHRSIR